MEIFFDIAMMIMMFLCLMYMLAVSKEIKEMRQEVSSIMFHVDRMKNELGGDFVGVEKAFTVMSQKIEAIPDIIKDDNYRSWLAFKDTLETTKPIKPNNWGSMKEAFKVPTRVAVNERD